MVSAAWHSGVLPRQPQETRTGTRGRPGTGPRSRPLPGLSFHLDKSLSGLGCEGRTWGADMPCGVQAGAPVTRDDPKQQGHPALLWLSSSSSSPAVWQGQEAGQGQGLFLPRSRHRTREGTWARCYLQGRMGTTA